MIPKILAAMGMEDPIAVTQLENDEDGSLYQVWRIDYPDKSYVMKQAKGNEAETYRRYFSVPHTYVPKLYASARVDDMEYLLMEHIPGHDLKSANRADLKLALDALIAMQKDYWLHSDSANTYENSLMSRQNRRKFLLDSRLEQAYDAYLADYSRMPRTLCHDDLLPFNVILSQNRAVLIDWEIAGILPYPTSLARLIAHGEEDENAFFYLKQGDRAFAIDYYFQHFVQEKRISREMFDRSLNLCLLYEYCEWVYVGNRYGNQDSVRFRTYFAKALQQAEMLGFR